MSNSYQKQNINYLMREWHEYEEYLMAKYPAEIGEKWEFNCPYHLKIDQLIRALYKDCKYSESEVLEILKKMLKNSLERYETARQNFRTTGETFHMNFEDGYSEGIEDAIRVFMEVKAKNEQEEPAKP